VHVAVPFVTAPSGSIVAPFVTAQSCAAGTARQREVEPSVSPFALGGTAQAMTSSADDDGCGDGGLEFEHPATNALANESAKTRILIRRIALIGAGKALSPRAHTNASSTFHRRAVGWR
jgi:hypothetical protein